MTIRSRSFTNDTDDSGRAGKSVQASVIFNGRNADRVSKQKVTEPKCPERDFHSKLNGQGREADEPPNLRSSCSSVTKISKFSSNGRPLDMSTAPYLPLGVIRCTTPTPSYPCSKLGIRGSKGVGFSPTSRPVKRRVQLRRVALKSAAEGNMATPLCILPFG